MKADVIFVIGANPTDGHPVFASQMKRRLRQGAKLIVADPRRIDLVRTPHIDGRAASETAARHQRRADQFPGACDRHGGPGQGRLCARALRAAGVREVAHLRLAREEFSGSDGGRYGRPRRRRSRGGASVCNRRQWRHLLRPRRDRAQPGLDHGHGYRESRHGHRQRWPRRRGHQSTARPEQCAGLLRHGVVPARVPGLSPCLG